MAPDYLLEKYSRQDVTSTMDVSEEDETEEMKPMRTKWQSGCAWGFLGKTGPHGVRLQDFFLKQLEAVVADAAKSNDPVLMLAFCHGDYNARGGLNIGHTSHLLCPSHVAEIMSKYPEVRITMYMTSCFSGHWVETTELKNNKSTVLASAGPEEDLFGFVWSHSQRYAGGLFSSATISELMKDPEQLSEGTDPDLSREYSRMTTDMSMTAEIYRLCLPENIPAYGSSPSFTDPMNSDKFWRRTGYALHHYKANYDTLQRIPASNPHPKQNCKKYIDGIIDSNEPDVIEWGKRHPGVFDEDYPEATAGYGGTRQGLGSRKNISHIIQLYTKAQRGCKAYSETKLVADKIRMYQQNPGDPEKQVEIRRMLTARIALDKLADQYQRALNLDALPVIEKWDTQHRGPEADKFARMITESQILGIFPREILGYSYRRPAQYLAAEMTAAKYAEANVHSAIEKLQEMKSQGAFTDVASKYYLSTRHFKDSVGTLRKILEKSRGKVRPSLPTNWGPMAVEAEE